MTVVAAIARDGQVVIAADRQTTYQGQAVFGARKIRRHVVGDGEVLLAVAGNGALPNVLRQHLVLQDDVPTDLAELDIWADVVASAVTEVLAGSTPELLATDQHDSSRSIDGALLLAAGGQLFYLFTHQAVRVPDGVASLGSGAEVALGAMHAALHHGTTPAAAVRQAVELACRFSLYCSVGPGGEPLVELLA